MEEVSMANAVAARSEREASANAGLGVATDGRKCSSRGSELLVEWPSPRANRKDDGRQESVSEDHANGDANGDDATSSSSSGVDDGSHSRGSGITSTDQQQTTPTAVHFSPTIRIKIIPSLQDYSPERIERTYYTQADYAELKREYAATAKEMRRRHRRGEYPLQVHEVKLSGTRQEPHPQQQRSPSPTITTATTTRGLEHMASTGTLEFHLQEKSNSIDAVLLAQENDSTPEEIAVLYGRRARMALARATRQGLDDAQHAHFY